MPPTGQTIAVGPAEAEGPTRSTAAEQAARSPLLRALVAKYLVAAPASGRQAG